MSSLKRKTETGVGVDFFFFQAQEVVEKQNSEYTSLAPTLHYPPPSTLAADAVCVGVYEHMSFCVWQSKGSFLSLLSTWMGAVSEMEVLTVSLLEESWGRRASPVECRFYDSDLNSSEVTIKPTHSSKCASVEEFSCSDSDFTKYVIFSLKIWCK